MKYRENCERDEWNDERFVPGMSNAMGAFMQPRRIGCSRMPASREQPLPCTPPRRRLLAVLPCMQSFVDAAAERSAAAERAVQADAPGCRTAEDGWSARAVALAMAAHPRCGQAAAASVRQVAGSPDLLSQIMRNVWLVVPDDVPTLVSALRRAVPWQRVLLRRGEHLVSSKSGGDPGSSQLRISRPVEICGEEGSILRGTLVLDSCCVGGALRSLRIDDGGDCCVRCEGGSWELAHVRLRCSHGSALHVCGAARVAMADCVLGGEDDDEMGASVTLSAYGSVQETGLHKRSCYAVVARNGATIFAARCALRQCSEAALLVGHSARARLERCHIAQCAAAFMAGQGRGGRLLELSGCHIEGSVVRMWADADRPARNGHVTDV